MSRSPVLWQSWWRAATERLIIQTDGWERRAHASLQAQERGSCRGTGDRGYLMIVFKVEPEPCGAFNSPLIRWQLEGIPEEQIEKATSQHVHLNLNRFNVCLEQLLNRYFFFFLGPGGEKTTRSTGLFKADWKKTSRNQRFQAWFQVKLDLGFFFFISDTLSQTATTTEKLKVSNRQKTESCQAELLPTFVL